MNGGKVIFKTDVEIVTKIIFPKSKLLLVYDPLDINSFSNQKYIISFKKRVDLISFLDKIESKYSLVNFSNERFTDLENHDFLEGMLDFSNKNNKTFTKYFFINNPDGTMRWVFPKSNSTPCFLNLYNGSGWKAKLFVAAARVLNKLNFLQPITDGQFSVFFKNKEKFKTTFDEIPFDDFAIFTGTIGENRKAIISLSKNKSCTHFIKIPLTSASLDLVENEFQQLSYLEQFNYSSTIIPKVKCQESQIAVSNVLPNRKNSNQDWSPIHWNSLEELYHNSYQKKSLEGTPFWKTIKDGIAFLQQPFTIKNGLQKDDIEKLKDSAEQLFYNIDATKPLPLGIGHGDFTPWNMYVGNNKLHIYDWEMSQSDFPLLFDVYHYFFQKGILIQRENFQNIKSTIQVQFQDENAQKILREFEVNEEKHFQLYLLYIVCYYLPKYLAQPKLHNQVHWLVSTWIDAFQNINDGSKVVYSNAS